MKEKRVIAAFDFDGTITTKDTLFDFIDFCFGKTRLFIGLLWLSPMLMLYKIGLVKNYKAKEIFLSHFFKGVSVAEFNDKGSLYSKRIDQISRYDVMEKMNWHLSNGHTVLIISASVKNWILPWANKKGIADVLSTEIEEKEGRFTGKLFSKNCYGIEKVRRFQELYPKREDYILYAYGDSRGDDELLAFADYSTKLS